MIKKPRVNKTKAELIIQQKQEAKIAHSASLVKIMFPLLETQESIYDAQTALHALGGYIEYGLKIKDEGLKVGELGLKIELEKEKDSKVKTVMLDILGLIEIENARDTMILVRKLADVMGQFGASQFVKGPMTNIKITDIVK